MPDAVDFLVRHDDIHTHHTVTKPVPECGDGQVVLRVQRFALTSNNITYAKLGHSLGYWKLFPGQLPGWGRLPAMGYAVVETSRHPSLSPGDRISGFVPTSSHMRITPGDQAQGIVVTADHRQDLAPGYSAYHLVHPGPQELEDRGLLLNGLFMTGFLLDDFLATQQDFGAAVALLSSASSKTAISMAHQLRKRSGPRVVGITSAQNLRFVQALGCYHEVLTYEDDLETLEPWPLTYVDFAGNGALTARIHEHFDVRKSVIVGATHWDTPAVEGDLPGPTPELFFAPTHGRKRAEDLGPGQLGALMGQAWGAFAQDSQQWLHVLRVEGAATLEGVYDALLQGRVMPHEGYVLSL